MVDNIVAIIKMKLETLIAECTAYDFKLMLEERKPKSWVKSISAFANGLGGSLFVGIDNDGVVRGLDDMQHVCETISSKIRDYMDPLPDVEMIPCTRIIKLKTILSQYWQTLLKRVQAKSGIKNIFCHLDSSRTQNVSLMQVHCLPMILHCGNHVCIVHGGTAG